MPPFREATSPTHTHTHSPYAEASVTMGERAPPTPCSQHATSTSVHPGQARRSPSAVPSQGHPLTRTQRTPMRRKCEAFSCCTAPGGRASRRLRGKHPCQRVQRGLPSQAVAQMPRHGGSVAVTVLRGRGQRSQVRRRHEHEGSARSWTRSERVLRSRVGRREARRRSSSPTLQIRACGALRAAWRSSLRGFDG